ncbi:hypothetical protein D3C80_590270 [compost metagenome]
MPPGHFRLHAHFCQQHRQRLELAIGSDQEWQRQQQRRPPDHRLLLADIADPLTEPVADTPCKVTTTEEDGDHQRQVHPHLQQDAPDHRRQHGALALRLDVAQPLAIQRKHPRQAAGHHIAKLLRQRVGRTDQVRRQQRGDGRYCDRHRVQEVAGHLQRHAQRRDDEGKLANLRKAHAHPQRRAPVITGNERPHATGEHLAQYHRQGNDHDRPGVIDEYLRVDHQADGDEEDGAEQVTYRLDQAFDLQQLTRFGHDRANQEGAQHHAVFQLHHQQAEAEAQAKHGNQQHFVAFELGHIGQQPRHQQNADDQGNDHEQRQFSYGGEHFPRADRAADSDAGQQGDDADAEDVLDDQHAEDQLGEALVLHLQVVQCLDDDGGRGNGQDRAEEQ